MTIKIEETDQVEFHTDLSVIVNPFKEEFKNLNWLLTDLQFMILDSDKLGLVERLNHHDKSITINGEELFEIIRTRKIQFIWGVLSGFVDRIPNLVDNELPYADQNTELWTNPEAFQTESTQIEIVCWDSSLTIIKFRDNTIAQNFMREFKDSTRLEYNAL